MAEAMPSVDAHLKMDSRGNAVVGQNLDLLPKGCRALVAETQFSVHVGKAFNKPYGFDASKWQVEPCARVTVTLVNGDSIRHQWIVRGLPEEIYPKGVFGLEAAGGEKVTGSFITPPKDSTYPVGSLLYQQHAELIVGEGADLGAAGGEPLFSGMLVLGFVAAVLSAPYGLDWLGKRFFAMSGKALSEYLFDRLLALVCPLWGTFASISRWFGLRKMQLKSRPWR